MITVELLERLCPTKGLNPKKYNLVRQRPELVAALNKYLPAYEINTHKRVAAFLSCCGVETDYFRTTEEYASGADYEGRRDLGNTQKGDGRRFKGRGLIQTTGRDNYTKLRDELCKEMCLDFVADPGLLSIVEVAVESACVYWKVRKLNDYADKKEIKQLNGIVNRGSPNKVPLHWAKRNELYSKCIRYIPTDFTFKQQENQNPEFTEGVRPIEITPEMESKFSSATATLQNPSIKTIGIKVATRVGTPLGAAWATTTGRLLLILTVSLLLAGLGYLGYLYRTRIQLGWQIAVLTIKKKVGMA